ncbi:hypothetical protein BDW66DRAFT_36107 [Aspergillus desertorum]
MAISGQYFPEGLKIGSPIYALHRREENFWDADAFKTGGGCRVQIRIRAMMRTKNWPNSHSSHSPLGIGLAFRRRLRGRRLSWRLHMSGSDVILCFVAGMALRLGFESLSLCGGRE